MKLELVVTAHRLNIHIGVFSALTLLVWHQKEHPACKHYFPSSSKHFNRETYMPTITHNNP